MIDFSFMDWAALFVVGLAVVYVFVRVGAIAWFRTRREHAHRLMREMMDEREK